jgi:hypothetical protein
MKVAVPWSTKKSQKWYFCTIPDSWQGITSLKTWVFTKELNFFTHSKCSMFHVQYVWSHVHRIAVFRSSICLDWIQ